MRFLAFVALAFLLLGSKNLLAQTDTSKTDKKTQAILENLVGNISQAKSNVLAELGDGTVLDQTKTRAGKDFYDLFIQQLEIPPTVTNYNILIDERPGLGTSTIISVYINDIEVYANYLQLRRDQIEETAAEAVELATEFILNYNQIILELSSQEQSGTGIF